MESMCDAISAFTGEPGSSRVPKWMFLLVVLPKGVSLAWFISSSRATIAGWGREQSPHTVLSGLSFCGPSLLLVRALCFYIRFPPVCPGLLASSVSNILLVYRQLCYN